MDSGILIASLATGSDGNSYIYSVGAETLFIDMGIGSRLISSKLKELAIDPSGIVGAVISHHHSDHWTGASLSNKYKFPLLGTKETIGYIENHKYKGFECVHGATIEGDTGTSYGVGPFRVYAFATIHDTPGSLGFLVEHEGAGPSLFVLTDTGVVKDNALYHMNGGDYLIMESNYDESLLIQNQEYSEELKDRIRSEYGHLSNYDAAMAVDKARSTGAHVYLAHLSQHNNTPDIAELNMLAEADVDATALQRYDNTILLDSREREEDEPTNRHTESGSPGT